MREATLFEEFTSGGVEGLEDAAVADEVEHAAVEEDAGDVRQGFLVAPEDVGVGDVAASTQFDGHGGVGGCPAHGVILPVFRIEQAVFVEVLHVPVTGVPVFGDFVLGKFAVAILVVGLEHFREGGQFDAFGGFTAGGPAVEVEDAVVDDGDGLDLVGETADLPEELAGGGVVAGHLVGAGNDDFVTVDQGRGETVDHLGAFDAPDGFAGGGVDGDEEGFLVLVADHDDFVAGENRGSAHAVEVGEGAQGKAPALAAVFVVGEQAEAGEEDVDVAAIRDGAGGGGVVQLVTLFVAVAGRFLPPEELAGLAVEGEGEELAVFVTGEEDAVNGDDGRGLAFENGGFPDDVGIGSDLAREVGTIDDAGAAGSAKAEPVGGRGEGGEEAEDGGESHGSQ